MKSSWVAVVGCAAALGLGACSESATAGNEAAAEQQDVLAEVGDQKITRQQVMEKASSALAGLKQQEYEILRGALDESIEELLLDAAASKEGLTREEYVGQKIDGAVSEPSAAEIEDFYNQNRARLQGRTLDSVRGQIGQYLQSQRRAEQYQRVMSDLRKDTKVAVMLDPPRIDVSADDDPSLGPDDAPVTIVAFTDYECPYCSRAEETVKQLLASYSDKIRVVVRDYPLDFHKNAEKAAEAAGCAFEQGKFEEMHYKLFENQRALGQENLVAYAGQVGLDVDKFRECLDSGRRTEEVRADFADGQAVGVNGTPAFFVNGRLISGAMPFDDFAKVIDEELSRN